MKYMVLPPFLGLLFTFQFLTAQQTFSKKEVSKLKVIIPDFQVNENAGPNGAGQEFPSISADSSGNFVVTWMDGRNGDGDIYVQRYSSDGTPLGTNFKVNDDRGVAQMWADQRSPVISVDSRGNFVIVWNDSRNDYGDIYAQRYTGDGSALGTNFKVNDDEGSLFQQYPSISTDGSGNFVIAWRDISGIYAQRYSSDGSNLGNNFKVNDDQGTVSHWDPSISNDGNGNFTIAWYDYRNGDPDIYAQRYSSDGVALGSNFKVNDDQGTAGQWFTSISIDGGGNFVITWYDDRNGDADVYAQRYTSDGSTLGPNFKVNDDRGITGEWSPSISSDGRGNFMITWRDERNGDYDIYVQRYASDGSTLGNNFKVNDDEGRFSQKYPCISTDSSGNFAVTWTDYRNGETDVYVQRYASDGNSLGSNFKVNDDQGSAQQLYSSISNDESGNFALTWIDERNGNPDIYAQRFTSVGSPLGTNFKVNDDQGDAWQLFPSVSTTGSGNFIITWADERNSNNNHDSQDIYAQCYASDGNPLGSNFKVNDDEGSAEHRDPSISTDSSGNFVIVWEDGRNSDYENYDIYAQRYASDVSSLGTNFKVNSDEGEYHWNPSIATDGSGNFVIAWMGDWQIYVQRYASDGSPLGSNLRVSDDEEFAYYYPSVSMESSGNYVITWEDWRNGWDKPDIYMRRYASDSSPLDSSLKVNDIQGSATEGLPSISSDGSGNFIITWTDERNGNGNIYAQLYASDGGAVDSNFRVTNTSNSIQSYSDVKLWNGRIYNTWTDNRAGGTGYDIWANVLEWEKNIPIIIPDNYALYQNYPNPFNPGTTIEFDLPRTSKVTLKIYNILGEEVATLVLEELNAGSYSYEWSRPASVASGVYLYRLEAGEYFETKKMVLIR